MSDVLMNIIGSPEAMWEVVEGNRAFVESLPELDLAEVTRLLDEFLLNPLAMLTGALEPVGNSTFIGCGANRVREVDVR
ncbi:MAG: hypothetical protein WBV94_34545 [Blastocatellia bacterium]